MIFAKLFQIEMAQVLIQVSSETDENGNLYFILSETTEIEGIRMDVKHSFKEQDNCQNVFDAYKYGAAVYFYNQQFTFLHNALAEEDVPEPDPESSGQAA